MVIPATLFSEVTALEDALVGSQFGNQIAKLWLDYIKLVAIH